MSQAGVEWYARICFAGRIESRFVEQCMFVHNSRRPMYKDCASEHAYSQAHTHTRTQACIHRYAHTHSHTCIHAHTWPHARARRVQDEGAWPDRADVAPRLCFTSSSAAPLCLHPCLHSSLFLSSHERHDKCQTYMHHQMDPKGPDSLRLKDKAKGDNRYFFFYNFATDFHSKLFATGVVAKSNIIVYTACYRQEWMVER